MVEFPPTMAQTLLWLIDSRNVQNHDLAHFERQLSQEEANRFANFSRSERRRQYLLGRMLLRLAISHATGLASSAIGIIERPHLGPQLLLPGDVPHPAFSLSHSHHWIACATTLQIPCDEVLGLDVEVIDPKRDILALSEAAFNPAEHAWLIKRNDEERIAAFYRLWTLKEALVKLRSHEPCVEDAAPLIDSHGELRLQGEAWFSSSLEHPHLSISICSTRMLDEIVCVTPSLERLDCNHVE